MESTRVQKARRVTLIGFFVNLFLVAGKLLAGIFGRSSAMIADAIHSLSDVVTDVIVIAFMRISEKGSDDNHRYGHGKFETFATLLISVALFAVGIGICISGIEKIIDIYKGVVIESPTYIALIAAFVSIIMKEGIYRYTVKVGESINSQAVIANAWHHRSDAFSSLGTLAGIGGAIILGGKWIILDPLACVIVSFFILKVAIELCIPSINELLEKALPKETETEIMQIISSTEGVISSHKLKTRKIGNNYAIDVHVQIDANTSFVESHNITSLIEKNLREKYGQQTQISIHAEPILD